MAYKYNEDLFRDTTMTFGEHLEDLRSSLWKAVLCLAIGVGIGLWYGDWVVRRIQDPLVGALTTYYQEQAVERLARDMDQRRKLKQPVPAELATREAIERVVLEGRLLPEEVYLLPRDLVAELGRLKLPPVKGLEGKAVAKKGAPDRASMLRLTLWRPVEDDSRLKVKTLSAPEAFMIYIKAALLFGLVISSPAVFYFVWAFIAAGLYPHERKYVTIFLPFSLGLFLLGASLAFFAVFPPVLKFFFSYNAAFGAETEPRLAEWLSFVLLLPVGFGISFQLPLIMLFLERIGVFTVADYMARWKIAVLVMAVASMVLTPGGDPTSMVLMLGPLILLYFLGMLLCKWMPREALATAE